MKLQKEYLYEILRVNFENLSRTPKEIVSEITSFCDLSGIDNVFLNYTQSTLRPIKQRQTFEIADEIKQKFLDTIRLLVNDNN